MSKSRPYRIVPSVFNPGKFAVKCWTGHKNLPIEIQYKLYTPRRFNSIAEAMDELKTHLDGLAHHG